MYKQSEHKAAANQNTYLFNICLNHSVVLYTTMSLSNSTLHTELNVTRNQSEKP